MPKKPECTLPAPLAHWWPYAFWNHIRGPIAKSHLSLKRDISFQTLTGFCTIVSGYSTTYLSIHPLIAFCVSLNMALYLSECHSKLHFKVRSQLKLSHWLSCLVSKKINLSERYSSFTSSSMEGCKDAVPNNKNMWKVWDPPKINMN